MDPVTVAANFLLQRTLEGAAVESFGLLHQFHFLKFRDKVSEDHILSIDTEISSNVVFDESLVLTEDEKILLLFNRVNLCVVTCIECDDFANLTVEFDNGVKLQFAGSPKENTSESWQLASKAAFETGGYLIIATYAGGYAIWDYTVHN